MSTLDASYAAPHTIALCADSAGATVLDHTITVKSGDSVTFYPSWYSERKKFQLRYRWQRMVSPNPANDVDGGMSDWGAWQNTRSYTGGWKTWDAATDTIGTNGSLARRVSTRGITLPSYNQAAQTVVVLQVQVRAFNSTTVMHGNTGEMNFIINYLPTINSVACKLDSDGGLLWSFTTDSPYDRLPVIYRLGKTAGASADLDGTDRSATATVSSGTASFKTPVSQLAWNADVGDVARIRFKHVQYADCKQDKSATIASKYTRSTAAPTIAVTDNHDGTARLTITEGAASYTWTSVGFAARSISDEGKKVSLPITASSVNLAGRQAVIDVLVPVGGSWQYQVAIENTATDDSQTVYNSGWVTSTVSSPYDGIACVWVAGVGTAGVRAGLEQSMDAAETYDADGESVKCAGRVRPVARTSDGGSSALTLDGIIMHDDIEPCTLSAWKKIQTSTHKTGWLLYPNGLVFHVRVKTMQLMYGSKMDTVQLSFEEVS